MNISLGAGHGQAVPLQPQTLLLTFARLEGTVASPWCRRWCHRRWCHSLAGPGGGRDRDKDRDKLLQRGCPAPSVVGSEGSMLFPEGKVRDGGEEPPGQSQQGWDCDFEAGLGDVGQGRQKLWPGEAELIDDRQKGLLV